MSSRGHQITLLKAELTIYRTTFDFIVEHLTPNARSALANELIRQRDEIFPETQLSHSPGARRALEVLNELVAKFG
ncbi:MAG: hypothetical protein OXU69_08865 [Gemmatimonadota bacterium]|nr:hypothetical protein [Gemmatimonadota bacterium]MDE2984804.1 hypothetical protein [Gemmatimonadota bacterium]